MLHSVSSVICNEFNHSQSQQSINNTSPRRGEETTNQISEPPETNEATPARNKCVVKTTSFVSGGVANETSTSFSKVGEDKVGRRTIYKRIVQESSLDSETSQGEEHNFSELLNLSVCASSLVNCELQQVEPQYSIANSVTVSDISSLANLGTPDSPPRATSPTLEIRELLDKIQQLPQHKSPTNEPQTPTTSKFFVRNKSKTLYMPLNSKLPSKTPIFSNFFQGKSKNWLSRSAPTTPSSNFAPLFPKTGSQRGSKIKIGDNSALLESGDQENNDDCL